MNDDLYMSLIRLLPRQQFSWTVRRLASWNGVSALSNAGVKAFAKVFSIDVEEAEFPLDQYDTVHSFFTRRLKPGRRPIDIDEDSVVSPVDGVVSQWGTIDGKMMTQVKGQTYSVSGLLGGEEEGASYINGTFLTIYLSPRHYHRIHTPIQGDIVGFDHIPGELWPVNAPSVRSVEGLFAANERMVSYVKHKTGAKIAVVKVAAVGVGHISLAYSEREANLPGQQRHRADITPAIPVKKGDELGTFELGSTVILVFPPQCIQLDALQAGQELKMGQRIGHHIGSGALDDSINN